VGLSTMHKGSLEERLDMAFKAYDLNGDGKIDRDELFQILKTSFKTKGIESPDDMIRKSVSSSTGSGSTAAAGRAQLL
jgi:Ca2+-binding EF-hand superfamily protein